MNDYLKITKKHADEFSAFPIFFAFNKEQFKKGMEKLGLEEKAIDKICTIKGGGYLLKTDSQKLKDMFAAHTKEMADAVAADETGNGFIFSMFKHELDNHEYGYTFDDEDALAALGLSYEDIEKSEPLKNGLKLAKIGY